MNGHLILIARKELKITQAELARRAGISKGFLSDLENNKRKPSIDTLYKIGNTLNLSFDCLMSGINTNIQQSQVRIPSLLAKFALQSKISFEQVLCLLDLRKCVCPVTTKKFDWQKLYQAVENFL